jgi:hypothetical protein
MSLWQAISIIPLPSVAVVSERDLIALADQRTPRRRARA